MATQLLSNTSHAKRCTIPHSKKRQNSATSTVCSRVLLLVKRMSLYYLLYTYRAWAVVNQSCLLS